MLRAGLGGSQLKPGGGALAGHLHLILWCFSLLSLYKVGSKLAQGYLVGLEPTEKERCGRAQAVGGALGGPK